MIVKGHCSPKFLELKDIFQNYFENDEENGANFSVVHNGEIIINLYGGKKNKIDLWDNETIVNTFSLSKGVYAACVAKLIETKQLNLEQNISYYWPEFKKNKGNITVKHLLSHQSGLYRFKCKITNEDLLDFDKIITILEKQEPDHPPGAKTFYHAKTHGFLVEKLIRNITKQDLKSYFHENFSKIFKINFYFGLSHNQLENVAELEESISELNEESVEFDAFNNPHHDISFYNSKNWRLSSIPSMGGHGSALSVAKLYDILANDLKQNNNEVISKNNLLKILETSNSKMDESLNLPIKWTNSGFILRGGWMFGKNKESFGHNGWGGSLGFADPIEGLGIAYVTKKINPGMSADKRAVNLIKKFYDLI